MDNKILQLDFKENSEIKALTKIPIDVVEVHEFRGINVNEQNIKLVVGRISTMFTSERYSVGTHNCNHFTAYFIGLFLTYCQIPSKPIQKDILANIQVENNTVVTRAASGVGLLSGNATIAVLCFVSVHLYKYLVYDDSVTIAFTKGVS
eukprot:NODE_502_length_7546_cov_0.138982.p6 type:complete len:149 gc:universal NODE_502_length_7546_cov_0.138982:707-1153(+)